MGLTVSQRKVVLSQRKAVAKVFAARYAGADKAGKQKILNELCAITGWHRDHARRALRCALRPTVVQVRAPRPPKYGPKVVAALTVCWMVLGRPAGKRLAPILPELVPILREFGELDIDDDTATLLASMSAATIDRRLACERNKHKLRGRRPTKPRSLRKSRIAVRTWTEWDEAVPGFVEVDVVGHDGGIAGGEHVWTLTVTDIATGWTENRSMSHEAPNWVFAALDNIARSMPFPILGIGSGNASEFINRQLLIWCEWRQITFTRAQAGDKNNGYHVDRKNWGVVRVAVGFYRYDTEAELLLLNKIWALHSTLTNYFCPQQKLVAKIRTGTKVSKKCDIATTPHRRAEAHQKVTDEDKAILADSYAAINPAAVQRQIRTLTAELVALTARKAEPTIKTVVGVPPYARMGGRVDESIRAGLLSRKGQNVDIRVDEIC